MPCGNSSSLPQLEQKTVPSVRSWQFQQTSGASADVGTVFITFSETPHQAQKKWLASAAANHFSNRSEERRVGKECRSRGSPEGEKKKITDTRIVGSEVETAEQQEGAYT